MPGEVLPHAPGGGYGRVTRPPPRAQLQRVFFLERGRPPGGGAVQLGTVRFQGTFLADPLEVPAEVVAYVASQLGIADPACFRQYADREKTPYEHAWELRRVYGYQEFGAAEADLRTYLAARAWTA